MRAIGGIAIALVVIFTMMNFASADNASLIQDKKASDTAIDFGKMSSIFEIVLIPHPCDPDSNLLFSPNDPIVQCAQADEELIEYIEEIAFVIGFEIRIDDILFPEVTTLKEIEEQIIQLEQTSEQIFEHESADLEQSTADQTIIEQYDTIKEQWGKELQELEQDAQIIFEQNPGIESTSLQKDLEKLKIKFELKNEKIKNQANVDKKIKTAIELKSLKQELQESMNEYGMLQNDVTYGEEKDKKLEQLIKKNTKLYKKMLIAEAKHHEKTLKLDDFKKIHEIVLEQVSGSGSNSGTSSVDSIIGNESTSGSGSENNSGTGSSNSGSSSDNKGSDNKGKGSDKGKSDNKDKGKSNNKGKGNSKK